MITPERLRKLEQMGLGPVWVRRDAVSDASSATMNAAAVDTATAVHAADNLDHAAAKVPADPAGAMRPTTLAKAANAVDTAAIATMDWETLETSIRACARCRLCEGRTHAVPGVGDRRARWLFVGEGPGRTEDQQGEPFVGPAGKLLDNMLRALGLARGEATYIANVVKCRPTGSDGRDRPPAADEIAACLPYLQRQIEMIQPDVIVALGKVAALSLLGLPQDSSLSSVRGQPATYAGRPLVPTFHPAYLLRKPADKALAWRDLCLARRLGEGQS